MTYSTMITLVGGFSALLMTGDLQAGPIDASRHPHPEKLQMVHEAEHSVDHAWEVYHRAALGGTVASPDLQAQIEQHLHEARTLVTQAQEAADRGDTGKVERLVGEIKIHTAQAIAGSKEQKK
jgi:ferritin-like metal-binding protein YciE